MVLLLIRIGSIQLKLAVKPSKHKSNQTKHMKVSMQQKLVSFSLLTSVFGSTVMAAHVSSPGYIFQQAAVTRQNPLTVEHSIPSLPGKLALNETQKENILKINLAFNQKIHEILTLEQLQQFTAALTGGLTLLPALNTLSLTGEQKNKLRMALISAQQQIEQVLTPEQLEYVRQQQENQYNNQPPSNLKLQLANKKYYVILNNFSGTTV